jgi:hypothetical protein
LGTLGAAAALAAIGSPIAFLKYNGPAPRVLSLREPTGRLYSPNGKREVARRLRQIEAGQLKVSV